MINLNSALFSLLFIGLGTNLRRFEGIQVRLPYKLMESNAPINSKVQHPPPRATPPGI